MPRLFGPLSVKIRNPSAHSAPPATRNGQSDHFAMSAGRLMRRASFRPGLGLNDEGPQFGHFATTESPHVAIRVARVPAGGVLQCDFTQRYDEVFAAEQSSHLETRGFNVGSFHPTPHRLLSLEGLFPDKLPFRVLGAMNQETFVVARGYRRVRLSQRRFVFLRHGFSPG